MGVGKDESGAVELELSAATVVGEADLALAEGVADVARGLAVAKKILYEGLRKSRIIIKT